MSMIPALMGGRSLSHDAVSDKGWYTTGVGDKVQIFSDFLGSGALPLDSASGAGSDFVNHDTSSSGSPVLLHQASADGVYRMKFASTSEAEYLSTYLGDECCIPPTKNPVFEARVAITGTFSPDDRVVIGLASARNNSLDAIADHIWFRMEAANNNILVEGDDNGTTDNDDNDTSVDWTSGTFHKYKIDASDLSDVKFYVDGTQCVLPEKMDVSGMVVGDLLQPYIAMQKDSGTVEHSVDIDYISVLWDRS
mgnify:CR=1 FL=1|tara:strand:- start:2044 stop:2796 length:753 start_codon:yes stop_codon:yes gene_type:complete